MLDLILASALLPVAGDATPDAITFSKPVRLEAGGAIIRTESPGYAAPALYDLNGDGLQDLAVGQFRDGKIMVYPATKDGGFAEGAWLETGGEVAEVPGVW